jgi:hypothetical protein
MLGTKNVLPDGKGALVEGLGLGVPALSAAKFR